MGRNVIMKFIGQSSGKISSWGIFHRHLALVGGTANFADCLTALCYLCNPKRLLEDKMINKYEKAFAGKIGTKYAFSFCSGRVGLYGLLRLLGVGNSDEVLLQVPTHIVVANAIRYTGARPVFVDCSLKNYNIGIDSIRDHLTPQTKVLVVQHTFGNPVAMDKIMEFGGTNNLEVIEDCVHSLGSRYMGKPVGTFGRASFFSTEETKTISTTLGGMVCTNDSQLAAGLRTFQKSWPHQSRWLVMRYLAKFVAYYFLTEPHIHNYVRKIYEHIGELQPFPTPTSREELSGQRPLNYEARLSNAQCAIGLRQLLRLDANVAHRKQISKIYLDFLNKNNFEGQVCIEKDAEPAFVRFPVRVANRAIAVQKLKSHAVIGKWFTSVLEEAAREADAGYEQNSCPRAEEAARHLINLPTHPRVTLHDARRLAATTGEILKAEQAESKRKAVNGNKTYAIAAS